MWGFADYAAALSARRVGAVRTAFGMQATGLVSFAIALFAFGGRPALEPDEVPYARRSTALLRSVLSRSSLLSSRRTSRSRCCSSWSSSANG